MEESKILPLVEEVLVKVCSKLQEKAVRDYEVKVVRLIRDQENLGQSKLRSGQRKSAPSYRERLAQTTSRRQLGWPETRSLGQSKFRVQEPKPVE